MSFVLCPAGQSVVNSGQDMDGWTETGKCYYESGKMFVLVMHRQSYITRGNTVKILCLIF